MGILDDKANEVRRFIEAMLLDKRTVVAEQLLDVPGLVGASAFTTELLDDPVQIAVANTGFYQIPIPLKCISTHSSPYGRRRCRDKKQRVTLYR